MYIPTNRDSFFPYPCQQLLSLVFLIIANLIGMRWYCIVLLIWVSPMIISFTHPELAAHQGPGIVLGTRDGVWTGQTRSPSWWSSSYSDKCPEEREWGVFKEGDRGQALRQWLWRLKDQKNRPCKKAEAGVLGAKALKWEGVWEVPGTEKGQRHQSMKSGGREEPGPLKWPVEGVNIWSLLIRSMSSRGSSDKI